MKGHLKTPHNFIFINFTLNQWKTLNFILLQITKEDELPKNICQRCVQKLNMFFEFRVTCMTTDTILRNYSDTAKTMAAINNQVSKISAFYTEYVLCRMKIYTYNNYTLQISLYVTKCSCIKMFS